MEGGGCLTGTVVEARGYLKIIHFLHFLGSGLLGCLGEVTGSVWEPKGTPKGGGRAPNRNCSGRGGYLNIGG